MWPPENLNEPPVMLLAMVCVETLPSNFQTRTAEQGGVCILKNRMGTRFMRLPAKKLLGFVYFWFDPSVVFENHF
jgi:hypothetical protein